MTPLVHGFAMPLAICGQETHFQSNVSIWGFEGDFLRLVTTQRLLMEVNQKPSTMLLNRSSPTSEQTDHQLVPFDRYESELANTQSIRAASDLYFLSVIVLVASLSNRYVEITLT